MDRGLSLLFRLMSASWVFIGNPENENQNKVSVDETDQDEWFFPSDGTFDLVMNTISKSMASKKLTIS